MPTQEYDHQQRLVGRWDIYCSWYINEHKFGVEFVVGKILHRRLLASIPLDERLSIMV